MKNLNVVLAVGRKEAIELIRYKDWIINLLVWPILFPLFYILSALSLIGNNNQGIESFNKLTNTSDYIGFILVGAMVYMWINRVIWTYGTFLREEQKKGTLLSLWTTPTRKFNYLIGGAAVSTINSILLLVVSIIEYSLIYGIKFKGSLLDWVILILTLMPGVIGLGTMFASIVIWVKEANAAVLFIRGIIMVLCGITYPISVMPQFLQKIARGIPFTYGIEAIRNIMLNNKTIYETRESLIICLCLGVIYYIVGRILFYIVELEGKKSGTIGHF